MRKNLHPFAYLIIFAKSNPWGKGGRDFESCAVSEIISGDALVLVAKRTVQHRSKLLLFGWYCFHFWLRYNTLSLVFYIFSWYPATGIWWKDTPVLCRFLTAKIAFYLYFNIFLFILLFGYSHIVEMLSNNNKTIIKKRSALSASWILIIKKNILMYYVEGGLHGRIFMNIHVFFCVYWKRIFKKQFSFVSYFCRGELIQISLN